MGIGTLMLFDGGRLVARVDANTSVLPFLLCHLYRLYSLISPHVTFKILYKSSPGPFGPILGDSFGPWARAHWAHSFGPGPIWAHSILVQIGSS